MSVRAESHAGAEGGSGRVPEVIVICGARPPSWSSVWRAAEAPAPARFEDPGEHQLAGVHRGLFEITRVRGKHLPAGHRRAEDLNRSHLRKLATQAVVVLRRRRQPDAVVGSFVARVAQDEHDLVLHVDRETAEHRSRHRRDRTRARRARTRAEAPDAACRGERCPSGASSRHQPGWPLSLTHGTGNRHVVELEPVLHASKHQPAAAHVASAHERRWKQEPLAKDRQQHFDVLPGGDAAQQHHITIGSDAVEQRPRAALERLAIADIVDIDGLAGRCPRASRA